MNLKITQIVSATRKGEKRKKEEPTEQP